MNLRIRITKKSLTTLLIVSAWTHGALLHYISTAIHLITGSELLANAAMVVYYIMLIALSSSDWIQRIKQQDICLPLFFFFAVLFATIYNPENAENIIEQAPELFIACIPFYFVGLIMEQDDHFFDVLYSASFVAVLANFGYVMVILGTGREMLTDNLTISYSVLPHALLLIWKALEQKSLFRIAAALCSIIFILVLGSRGPVLSCIVFIALYIVYTNRRGFGRTLVFVIMPAIAIIVFVQSNLWTTFLLETRSIVESMNLSTRVVDAILFGAADGSNDARMEIYEIMLGYIRERPLLGYGIYGEWNMINYTAHQMILELWTHYGVIVGTIIAVTSLITMWRGYKFGASRSAQLFVILMVSFGVVRGIYAGSYLGYYMFLLMGFSVNVIRNHRRNPERRLV